MSLLRSVSLFTIVPVPVAHDAPERDAAAALMWLPAVGALAGAVSALPAVAIRAWAPHAALLGGVLAVAVLAVLTRGLHLDGLADTADGLGSAAPAERSLQIMRRPDIGPFGVVTVVLVLAADIAALVSVRGGAWTPVGALAVAAATGRVAAVHAAVPGVPAAHGSGFGALVAGRAPVPAALAETAAVLGLGTLGAWLTGLAMPWTVGSQLVALVAAWLLRLHTTRRLTGVTGDVFGALIEAATVVTLVGIALR